MESDRKKIQFVFDYIDKEMSISEQQIKSKVRKRDILDARRLFFYVMRKYFQYSFEKIGKITLHTHATVLHACKTFEDYEVVYPKITTLPYKDICFQLDLMKNSIDHQLEELQEKTIIINKKINELITIKQLQNGRKKLHS
jgi:hypothetical protein|tara:strand:+ start:112 stop:534 length:423 start_codon:yes stop_codon:yes gene_type:complete